MNTDRILIVSVYKPDVKFTQRDWTDLFDNVNKLGNFFNISPMLLCQVISMHNIRVGNLPPKILPDALFVSF